MTLDLTDITQDKETNQNLNLNGLNGKDTEHNFNDYGLRKELLEAIATKGFAHPTPVQHYVLSSKWRGRDMIVRARTGSGKTLAFLLPLLQDLREREREPRVLVLAPTRELAQQTAQEAEWLMRPLNASVVSLVGGMDMVPQLKALHSGAAVVVGTPGRVRDHIERETLHTAQIDHVVLDEGDLMLDMGFREELESILNAIPGTRHQNATQAPVNEMNEASSDDWRFHTGKCRIWLFSATMPDEMRTLAERYLEDPVTLSLVEEGAQHADISHRAYIIPSRRRFEGLVNILLWEHPKRTLVFCHTKMESIEIAQKLQDSGFSAAALQGDMTQNERNAVLASFKSGSVPCLVATNVAARGLDVEGVSHVIQLGLPDDQETFVHRSGRTGRAGNEGTNIILLAPPEQGRFRDMLRGTQMKVEWLDVPDLNLIRTVQRETSEHDLLSAPLGPDFPDCLRWAEDLLSRAEPKVLVAKLLSAFQSRISKGYDLTAELARERERRRSPRTGRSTQGGAARGGRTQDVPRRDRPRGVMTRLRSDRGPVSSVGLVLNALCTCLNVERGEIGAIRLMNDNSILVELMPTALARLEQGRAALARWGFHPSEAAALDMKRDMKREIKRERSGHSHATRRETVRTKHDMRHDSPHETRDLRHDSREAHHRSKRSR